MSSPGSARRVSPPDAPLLTSQSQPPDYETLLSQLATDINDAKLHLSEILLRERRWSFLINANLLAVWAVWVGLWWLRGLPLGLVGISGDGTAGKVIGVTGVGVGPMLWACWLVLEHPTL